MNFSINAIVCSALLGGFAGPAVAQQSSAQRQNQCFDQGYELAPGKYPAAYNASARIDVSNGWDVFVTGSFIYWWVGQDGMDFLGPIIGDIGLLDTEVLFQKFKWHPGFKASLGTNLGDSWEGSVQYTYLHTKNFSSNKNLFVPQSSKWRFNYDQLDATIERPFYEGKNLTVSPYGGVRGFWIRERYDYENALEYDENLSLYAVAKDWAVGLLTGIETHWLVGPGFRFEGDFSASLLYDRSTKVSVSFTEQQIPPFSLVNRGAIRSMFTMSGGLGWGSYFDKKNYHFDLLAEYEFALLPNRTSFRSIVNSAVFPFAANTGDLYMSGLTVTARFDF